MLASDLAEQVAAKRDVEFGEGRCRYTVLRNVSASTTRIIGRKRTFSSEQSCIDLQAHIYPIYPPICGQAECTHPVREMLLHKVGVVEEFISGFSTCLQDRRYRIWRVRVESSLLVIRVVLAANEGRSKGVMPDHETDFGREARKTLESW